MYPRRLPLNNLVVSSTQPLNLSSEMTDLIKDELNVRNVQFEQEKHNIKVKLNYKNAGKKYRNSIKTLEQLVIDNCSDLIDQYNKNLHVYECGEFKLASEDLQFIVENEQSSEDVECLAQGNLSIKLDLSVNDEQVYEFICNELCAKIQAYRREFEFDVTKPVWITIHAPTYLWNYMFEFTWKEKLNPTGIRFKDISNYTRPQHCNVFPVDVSDFSGDKINFYIEVTKRSFELVDYWESYCKWINEGRDRAEILKDLKECFDMTYEEYLQSFFKA